MTLVIAIIVLGLAFVSLFLTISRNESNCLNNYKWSIAIHTIIALLEVCAITLKLIVGGIIWPNVLNMTVQGLNVFVQLWGLKLCKLTSKQRETLYEAEDSVDLVV